MSDLNRATETNHLQAACTNHLRSLCFGRLHFGFSNHRELHGAIFCSFQEVHFYDTCIATCDNCTLSQSMGINFTVKLTPQKNWLLIDFPTMVKSVALSSDPPAQVSWQWKPVPDTMVLQSQQVIDPYRKWDQKSDRVDPLCSNKVLRSFQMQTKRSFMKSIYPKQKIHSTPRHLQKFINDSVDAYFGCQVPTFVEQHREPLWFPSNPYYNRHFQITSTPRGLYTFFKKFSRTYSSGTEYMPYLLHVRNLSKPFLDVRLDSYPFPSCPHIVHNHKLLSWTQAKRLCVKNLATLPEFYDRTEEKEFLAVLRDSKELFPVEAVFIGVTRVTKVWLLVHS